MCGRGSGGCCRPLRCGCRLFLWACTCIRPNSISIPCIPQDLNIIASSTMFPVPAPGGGHSGGTSQGSSPLTYHDASSPGQGLPGASPSIDPFWARAFAPPSTTGGPSSSLEKGGVDFPSSSAGISRARGTTAYSAAVSPSTHPSNAAAGAGGGGTVGEGQPVVSGSQILSALTSR